jgi:hypothetical protein
LKNINNRRRCKRRVGKWEVKEREGMEGKEKEKESKEKGVGIREKGEARS